MLVAEPWPEVEGLHDGLRELGYREGENVLLEYRFANGDAERFPALVADLMRLRVDVIVTWGTPATLAAIKATSSVPIIMSAGDPVGAGLVANLARPGANVTGFSSQTAGGGKTIRIAQRLAAQSVTSCGAVQFDKPVQRSCCSVRTTRGSGIECCT